MPNEQQQLQTQPQQAQQPTGRNLMEIIQNSSPSQLISSPEVGDRFKQMYAITHGIKNPALADAFYTAERFHFLKLLNDNPVLQSCTKLSLYGIFMDVSVNGLSFDPSMKHIYVDSNNVNVGTKENPKWEKRAKASISGIGELLLRQRQGQIKYADNVELVYDGDEFQYGSKNERKILTHIKKIPRLPNAQIHAAYLKFTRADGSIDYNVMTWEDLMDIKKFSKSQNSTAWTTGVAGMFKAKVLKHAFKTYPKVRAGSFTQLQSDTVDEDAEIIQSSPFMDYGLDDTMQAPQIQEANGQPDFTPHEEVTNDPQVTDPANTNPQNLQQVKPDNPQAGMAQAAANKLKQTPLDF